MHGRWEFYGDGWFLWLGYDTKQWALPLSYHYVGRRVWRICILCFCVRWSW